MLMFKLFLRSFLVGKLRTYRASFMKKKKKKERSESNLNTAAIIFLFFIFLSWIQEVFRSNKYLRISHSFDKVIIRCVTLIIIELL